MVKRYISGQDNEDYQDIWKPVEVISYLVVVGMFIFIVLKLANG